MATGIAHTVWLADPAAMVTAANILAEQAEQTRNMRR